MKKLIGIMLVLCVVAPASFAAQLDEYYWTGGATGNFTDAGWQVKVGTNTVFTEPAAPFESTNTTDYTAYARPTLSNNATLTINTDLAPLNKGMAQFQVVKGKIVVDAGGRLVIGGGYMHMSTNSVLSGMTIQNGGYYQNQATSTGNQAGTMMDYSTNNAQAFITVTGASTFDSKYFYLGRPGYTQTVTGTFTNDGTTNTVTMGNALYGSNGTTSKLYWKFLSDATATNHGVGKIDISTKIEFGSQNGKGGTSILNLVLGQALSEGDQIVLFDLAAGATNVGTLKNMFGQDLFESSVTDLYYGETMYAMHVTYKGGDTGNDVVLTVLPEPATLGLMGLGGLVLARRRRA